MSVDEGLLEAQRTWRDPRTGISEEFLVMRSGSARSVAVASMPPDDRRRRPPVLLCHAFGMEQMHLSRLEVRIARRRVLHLIEFTRKTAEIVNRSRGCTDGNARFRDKPVGGDGENGLRFRRLLPDSPPRCRVAVVEQCIHRTAMPEEDRWLYCHDSSITAPSRSRPGNEGSNVHHST